MKLKKLTKDQIEERKQRRKHLIRFALITSLIVNLFFIIVAIIGCSSVKTEVKNVSNNAVLNDKKLLNNSDLDYFNSSLGYYIKNGDSLFRPTSLPNKEYITNYYVSLGSNLAVVVRDSNDSSKTLDESWHVYFNIHSPIANGDYIRFETPNWTRVYSVSLPDDTFYLSQEVAPEDYTYEEIYLPTSLDYLSSNYQRFREDMEFYFKEIHYYDYQLNYDWSPLSSIRSSNKITFYKAGQDNPDLVFVNNAIYGNSFALLDNTLFSVNGRLYTHLLVHCQVLNNPRFNIYNENYEDFSTTTFSTSPVYFADFVYAYNSSSEQTIVVWQMPYEDSDNTYSVYKFLARFSNNQVSKIRLFDRHLGYNSVPGYTNGNILDVQGYIEGQGSNVNGEIGDVFTLISGAFSGLTGLFSIGILPGITFGMLLFIPLVAGVVFAIVKIIKK